jgi:superfamily II DNA or RNA helicase
MVDINRNSNLFNYFILNKYSQYKLPAIDINAKDSKGNLIDPCSIDVSTALTMKTYQQFVVNLFNDNMDINGMLIYHGMGSGKTITAINIFNKLYQNNSNIHVVFMIKASLRKDPWENDLNKWKMMNDNVHFVHYDGPSANKDFLELMKKLPTGNNSLVGMNSNSNSNSSGSSQILFVFDEVHNFIRNVGSNKDSNNEHGRASEIYNWIINNVKRNAKMYKIILLSATPVINDPYELALLFNMIKPDLFPTNEKEFSYLYISNSSYNRILKPEMTDTFARRITGLVSYYIGATPDLFASKTRTRIEIPMSKYQYTVYHQLDELERANEAKAMKVGKRDKTYKTYTRQASNFVFPIIPNTHVSGVNRPRNPKLYGIEDENRKKLLKNQYKTDLDNYVKEFHKYCSKIDRESKDNNMRTLYDDVLEYKERNILSILEYNKYIKSNKLEVSNLYKILYQCSPKMTNILFNVFSSKGKCMIYSNYVIGEGLQVMKVYLELLGFTSFMNTNNTNNTNKSISNSLRYCEFHGKIESEMKNRIKNEYNDISTNKYGEKCKVILIGKSGTEGIQLLNIFQEHIMEPFWNNILIEQAEGRGLRQCSHKSLPLKERHVDIVSYVMTKPTKVIDGNNDTELSTEQKIDIEARAKTSLADSFLTIVKSNAVDCNLFKSHNMMEEKYSCYSFPQDDLFKKIARPAYKKNTKEDVEYSYGSLSNKAEKIKIKVMKIKGVTIISGTDDSEENVIYSSAKDYLYDVNTGIVYDKNLHYPVGKVHKIDGLVRKIDDITYVVEDLIQIPFNKN